MIDLHCHFLPGIDDGPDSVEGSIELARKWVGLGVNRIVATPHVNSRYPNRAEMIREARTVINKDGPWRTRSDVELATLTWIDWFNNRRLHGACGDLPPIEFEQQYQEASLTQ